MLIVYDKSVFPLLVVAALHLRLEESPKIAFDCPSDSVALLNSAFNNVLAVREDVCVNPHAFF